MVEPSPKIEDKSETCGSIQEIKMLQDIDQQTKEFRSMIHQESQKLKYQEQILKDVRNSLRQKENEVLYQDEKPRKSVTFFEDCIILNSIKETLDMNALLSHQHGEVSPKALINHEQSEVKPFNDQICQVRSITARPSARVNSQPHFSTNFVPRKSE